MLKESLKRLLYIAIFIIVVALLVDHLYYTIKTERLSDYTTQKLEQNFTKAKLLGEVDDKSIVVLYYELIKNNTTTLKVLTYQKSFLSEAYHMIDDITISPYEQTPLNKSYIVRYPGEKIMILFGYNSDYNIQVIRNRLVSEYYETSLEPNYLIMLDDIEQLYFYYESK